MNYGNSWLFMFLFCVATVFSVSVVSCDKAEFSIAFGDEASELPVIHTVSKGSFLSLLQVLTGTYLCSKEPAPRLVATVSIKSSFWQ